MWPYIAAMAVMGAVKGHTESNAKIDQANSLRRQEAAKTRYGQWTGQHGNSVADAPYDVVGPAFQGGVTGAAMGQMAARTDALKAKNAVDAGTAGASGSAALTSSPSPSVSNPQGYDLYGGARAEQGYGLYGRDVYGGGINNAGAERMEADKSLNDLLSELQMKADGGSYQ